MNARIQCLFCFEKFSVQFFLEDGETQETIYDCEVCCHPLELTANWDPDREKFSVEVKQGAGF